MFLAFKELKKERFRFTMIFSVIVLITYLVYFLSSLAFGLATLNKTAINHWQGDGVIVSKASNGNIFASSIDNSTIDVVKNDATPLINVASTNVYIADDKDESVSIVFIGYDYDVEGIVAPLIEGENISSEYDITISSNIRDEYDVEIGDVIELSDTGRTFTIVGFTENSNYNTQPVAYGHREMVSQVMLSYDTSETYNDTQSSATPMMPERVSAFLVSDEESLPNEALLKLQGLQYFPMNQFINELPGYTAQVLTFGLMIVSLSLIVSVIMGIFMYILTMQKKPVFAILKIQGYKNGYIIKSILIQIMTLLFFGILTGFLITYLTVIFIPSSVPVAINWLLIGIVSVFIVITSLIGAIFSATSVLKIDPLEAL